MLLEFRGVCQHCARELTVLVVDGIPKGDCPECKQAPFALRRIKGQIYVVKNPNQDGAKIGLTTKSIGERLRSLNSTGVPGSFTIVAVFASERPKADEKRVHERLKKYNIAKEHLGLDPIDAALKTYRALNKRPPIFYDEVTREKFELKLEDAKVQMKLRLKGMS